MRFNCIKLLGLLLVASNTLNCTQLNDYTFVLLVGPQIKTEMSFIAQQRINIFRGYPYLYEGNMQEELAYIQKFLQWRHSVVAVAYWQEKPVGFVSGVGLEDFDQHFQGTADLLDAHDKLYYYFSEGIILPEHRAKGLCKKLYELVENYAISIGYKKGYLVTESHDQHPLKPTTYKELHPLLQSLGYSKTDSVYKYSWQTIQSDGSTQEQEHVLIYWVKNFYFVLPE